MKNREDIIKKLEHLEYEYQILLNEKRAGANVDIEIGQNFVSQAYIRDQLNK